MNLLQTQRAVYQSGLDAHSKLVVLSLLDHWSRADPVPWPGIDRLVHWTSLSRRTVIATIASLESLGILKITRTPGRPNRYDLGNVCEANLPVHVVHGCTARTGAHDAPHQCTPRTTPVHVAHGGSARGAPEGIQEGTKEGIQGRDPGIPPLTLIPLEPSRDPAAEVFAYWAENLYAKIRKSSRDPKVSNDRMKHIRARLADGYSVDELKRAIDRVAIDDFALGRTEDNKTPYVEPENIFRSVGKVDKWLNAGPPPVRKRAAPQGDADELARLDEQNAKIRKLRKVGS